MLKSLFIRNFVLIDSLDIKFDKGFSVITGETGAGKSIILGALSLVLGQRADGKSIKNGSEKCVIEAVFDVSRYKLEEFFLTNDLEYDAEICILRRELFASGKFRARKRFACPAFCSEGTGKPADRYPFAAPESFVGR